jgi:glyoxylase I family protein
MFQGVNHVAIIVSDFKEAKRFYVDILGFKIINELDRTVQNKSTIIYLDAGNIIVELFLISNAPKRLSYPEAKGLRQLAFSTDNFDKVIKKLKKKGIEIELVRNDEVTGKKMTFFKDPDGLPLEICEI